MQREPLFENRNGCISDFAAAHGNGTRLYECAPTLFPPHLRVKRLLLTCIKMQPSAYICMAEHIYPTYLRRNSLPVTP